MVWGTQRSATHTRIFKTIPQHQESLPLPPLATGFPQCIDAKCHAAESRKNLLAQRGSAQWSEST